MPQAYIPYTVSAYDNRAILVRTAVHPLSLLKSVRAEIWAVDRNVAFSEAGTLTDLLQRYSYAHPEFGLVSLSAFAGIGLLLTAIGVFSVMAYWRLVWVSCGSRTATRSAVETVVRLGILEYSCRAEELKITGRYSARKRARPSAGVGLPLPSSLTRGHGLGLSYRRNDSQSEDCLPIP